MRELPTWRRQNDKSRETTGKADDEGDDERFGKSVGVINKNGKNDGWVPLVGANSIANWFSLHLCLPIYNPLSLKMRASRQQNDTQ